MVYPFTYWRTTRLATDFGNTNKTAMNFCIQIFCVWTYILNPLEWIPKSEIARSYVNWVIMFIAK